MIVSINRFERKKNVALAVEAFVHLQRHRSKAAKPLATGPLQLILAGEALVPAPPPTIALLTCRFAAVRFPQAATTSGSAKTWSTLPSSRPPLLLRASPRTWCRSRARCVHLRQARPSAG